MNLDASLERLFHRNLHIVKLDLEPMRALLEILGHPERACLCVHVAGTNGKGSVCANLASILREQGYRTGLYTSPHLIRFNERIQVNGEPIGDAALLDLIDEVEAAAGQLAAKGLRDATFFEFTTALAFLYFQRQAVDLVVLETGMGGRLDATNVVIPALSVITSIGFDHMQYLGNTLAAIAGEKAGIIKPGRPVVVGSVPPEAMEVIAARARSAGAPLIEAAKHVRIGVRAVSWTGQNVQVESDEQSYGTIASPLAGPHQAANLAIAVAAAECLRDQVGVAVSSEAIVKGLARTKWPARGQLLESHPPVVLDGAHNPEAAAMLAAWTKKAGGRQPLGMVVGFLADKDPAAFMQAFAGRVQRVWLVAPESDRAMPLTEAARRVAFLPHVEVCERLDRALVAARAWALDESGVVLVTGSLYLAGDVLSLYEKTGRL